MQLPLFGLLNVFSLLYLTGVVALVVGWRESDTEKFSPRHILGCWGKLLGALVVLMILVMILSLFAG